MPPPLHCRARTPDSLTKNSHPTACAWAPERGQLTVVKYLTTMGAVVNHRVLARQALGLPSQDDAVAGCSRKCCACSRNAGGSDKKAAKGTATGFAVRPHEAQPARKLQQWQLRERRQRWQAEREEEKCKAKYRKQHRMPKPRRRLGDLLDAPVDSEDPYVVVARRPCCASMGYDWRRKPYQQHIVGCCGKCFNCCCRAGCCKVIAIRTTLSVKLVKVLRAERAERLRVGLLVRVCPRARFAHAWRASLTRGAGLVTCVLYVPRDAQIPGKDHVTALDVAEMHGWRMVADFLRVRGQPLAHARLGQHCTHTHVLSRCGSCTEACRAAN